MTVPTEAIFVAANAITTSPLLSDCQITGWSKTVVTVALEAAAPLIAAAERDRIAGEMYAEADRGRKAGFDRIALRAFAERLREPS